MAKNKTTETTVSVDDFINAFANSEQKKKESHELVKLMRQWSGFEPRMWGPSIISFGSYHYQYASGHQGDAPLIAFSPRKAAFSLYVYVPTAAQQQLLTELGKFKMGKSCIYVKKLADINLATLEKMCRSTIAHVQAHPNESGC